MKKFLFLNLAAFWALSTFSQTKVLCIGESSTSSYNPGYRGKLKTLLAGIGSYTFIGPLSDTDGKHAGYSGEPCYTLYGDGTYGNLRITNLKNSGYNPDLILLLEGTNDCGWAYQAYSVGRTLASELSTLIDVICANFPNAKLFVSAIMPMSNSAYYDVPTPNGKAASNVIIYNNAMPNTISSQAAEGKEVYYTGANTVLLSDLSSDGIHPLQKGYDKIANSFFNAIKAQITDVTTDIKNNKLGGAAVYFQNKEIRVDLTGVSGESSIAVFNSLGVEVKAVQSVKALASIVVSVKGIYFVRVINSGKLFCKKVIVN